jgi:hypothetical protein
VVVIHPLAGYREARAFATDPGRLRVALSRHRAHATVVVDTSPTRFCNTLGIASATGNPAA